MIVSLVLYDVNASPGNQLVPAISDSDPHLDYAIDSLLNTYPENVEYVLDSVGILAGAPLISMNGFSTKQIDSISKIKRSISYIHRYPYATNADLRF